jgi:hypothetical protein
MRRFSRRTWLQGSAVLAPLCAAPPEPVKRNLLTTGWPADQVGKVLLPRGRFRPFPVASDLSPWEALPADARSPLVQSGETQLKVPWDVLPATLALEFKRNGNRSHYEAVRDRRRKKLQDLVMAE